MPRPVLTPSPRRIHQSAAPPIPAPPVPEAHAPSASRDMDGVGSVVDNWRNVISPNPEENEATPMPRRRRAVELNVAITIMPVQLAAVQTRILRLYRTTPELRYGHKSLVVSEGKMLKNATRPLGVDGGTRSSAAERMMT